MIITWAKNIKTQLYGSKIITNIAITFFSKIFKASTILILMILTARDFGAEGKGIITMALFLPDFLYFTLHLGLGNASIFFLSNHQENEKTVFNNTFWEGLLLSFIAMTITLLLKFLKPDIMGIGFPNELFYLALLIVPFSFLETFLENVFAGKQQFKIFNGIIIIDRLILTIVMIVMFTAFKITLTSIIILVLINLMIQVLSYFIILVREYGWPNIFAINMAYFRKAIDFGMRSYLACFLCYLILRSDLYMLSTMKGMKEVGFYSVATNFIDAMLLLSASASAVIFPLISKENDKSVYYIKKFSGWMSVISILAIVLTLMFGSIFIQMFFGKQFVLSVKPLFILLIAMYFWSLLSIITQFFAANNYPWKAVYIWIPGIVLNIVINWIWIPKYGMLAAAWSSVLAYGLTFMLHFILLNKYQKVHLKELLYPKK